MQAVPVAAIGRVPRVARESGAPQIRAVRGVEARASTRDARDRAGRGQLPAGPAARAASPRGTTPARRPDDPVPAAEPARVAVTVSSGRTARRTPRGPRPAARSTIMTTGRQVTRRDASTGRGDRCGSGGKQRAPVDGRAPTARRPPRRLGLDRDHAWPPGSWTRGRDRAGRSPARRRRPTPAASTSATGWTSASTPRRRRSTRDSSPGPRSGQAARVGGRTGPEANGTRQRRTPPRSSRTGGWRAVLRLGPGAASRSSVETSRAVRPRRREVLRVKRRRPGPAAAAKARPPRRGRRREPSPVERPLDRERRRTGVWSGSPARNRRTERPAVGPTPPRG